MKGILADVHVGAFVDALLREMQTDYWADYWEVVGPVLYAFEDVGLMPESTDLEIWMCCQREQLILLTNNRNQNSADSLETAIREHGTLDSLPVFSIGNLDRFRTSRGYAKRVVETLYGYLLDIDRVRSAGRLFLP